MTTTPTTDQRATPIQRCYRARAAGLQPDQAVWADEFAEAHRVMPPNSPLPGNYRNDPTPYLIDIQRTMSPASPYVEGWWQKPVQIGGSVSGENLILTWICAAAGDIMVAFSGKEKAHNWELKRFTPMRDGTRELRRRIRPASSKGSDNTKLRKKFPGGVLQLVTATRASAGKSDTVRYVKFEEPDDYPVDVEGQGNFIDLAINRTRNFGRRRKIFGDGTPTIEGQSAICERVARGDQRHWRLHCPDCGVPQRLVWAQLKVRDDEPDSARYACIDCGALNDEAAWKLRNYAPRRPGMTEEQAAAAGLAHWVPTAEGEPGVASWVGFNALGAPIGWRPWPELWAQWKAAQGDQQRLKDFVNNILAEPYTNTVMATIGADALQRRAENYALMTCPLGGLVLVASVDTQDNRLAVLFRAWGRGEESWGVWHAEIYGDTSQPEVWSKLRELLDGTVKHECGQTMKVDVAFIDEGGHRSEEVRAFCKDGQLRGRHWHPVAGARSYYAPKLGKPKKVEFTWRGVAVPGGIERREVGTQTIKHLIDGRLKLGKPGGGYYHFPLGFERDYYEQLRAETRKWLRDTRGRKELWWVNEKGARNEAWDLEVYNYAGYLFLMTGRHAETVFAAREKLYGRVRQLDLLDDGAPAPVQTPAPAADQNDDTADQAGPAEIVSASAAETEAIRVPVPSPKFNKPPRPKRGGFVNRWR